jgi:tetratricopeptide (TPR) repeat protein
MKTAGKLLIFGLTLLVLATSAYAQSPREELQQMVEQLQKAPNDTALREQIIKLAQELKPTPVIPTEAKRAFVMGGTYQREAKSLEDFGLAVKAFQDAVAVAPWWGDAYYNLSIALESAKRYDEAKSAITLYLLTEPKDAEQAEERLYAIEAKKNLAARAASAAQAAEERKKSSIEGDWLDGRDEIPIFRIERVGDALVVRSTNASMSFSEARITETSLSVTNTFLIPGSRPVRYELELRGDNLVGTAGGRPYHLTRKR